MKNALVHVRIIVSGAWVVIMVILYLISWGHVFKGTIDKISPEGGRDDTDKRTD